MSGKDDRSRERMPGDAEAAGAVQAMQEEQAGWRAGDRLTFVRARLGIDSPTPARVIRVMPNGCLVVETEGSEVVFTISTAHVVERLA